MAERPAVTSLLGAVAAGDPNAQGALHALVHDELKRIARGTLRRNAVPATMNPSTLGHEADGGSAALADAIALLAVVAQARGDAADAVQHSAEAIAMLARAAPERSADLARWREAAAKLPKP